MIFVPRHDKRSIFSGTRNFIFQTREGRERERRERVVAEITTISASIATIPG